MNWYYSQGEDRQGPVTTEVLRSLVERGELGTDSLVWNETFDGWKRLTEVELLVGREEEALCSECGRSFPTAETVEFDGRRVCAECKPRFVQRVREGGLTPAHVHYGGFWIRFAARVLDGLILFFANALLTLPFGGLMTFEPNVEPTADILGATCLLSLLQMAVSVGYEVGFVGAKGATPGKMVCGLRIVMADGGKLSYGRALGRQLATLLSSMTLMIGYLIAAFDDEKRALHDHICSTRVIVG